MILRRSFVFMQTPSVQDFVSVWLSSDCQDLVCGCCLVLSWPGYLAISVRPALFMESRGTDAAQSVVLMRAQICSVRAAATRDVIACTRPVRAVSVFMRWILTYHECRHVDVCLSRLLAYWRIWTFSLLARVSRAWHQNLNELVALGTDEVRDLCVECIRQEKTISWVMSTVFPRRKWRNSRASQSIAEHICRWRPLRPRRPRASSGGQSLCAAYVSFDVGGRMKVVSEGMSLFVANWYRRYLRRVSHLKGPSFGGDVVQALTRPEAGSPCAKLRRSQSVPKVVADQGHSDCRWTRSRSLPRLWDE